MVRQSAVLVARDGRAVERRLHQRLVGKEQDLFRPQQCRDDRQNARVGDVLPDCRVVTRGSDDLPHLVPPGDPLQPAPLRLSLKPDPNLPRRPLGP